MRTGAFVGHESTSSLTTSEANMAGDVYLLYLNGTNSEGPFEGSFVLLLSIAIAIQSFKESLGKHFQKPLLPSRCTSWNTIHYNGPTECMSGLVFLQSRVPNLCMKSSLLCSPKIDTHK